MLMTGKMKMMLVMMMMMMMAGKGTQVRGSSNTVGVRGQRDQSLRLLATPSHVLHTNNPVIPCDPISFQYASKPLFLRQINTQTWRSMMQRQVHNLNLYLPGPCSIASRRGNNDGQHRCLCPLSGTGTPAPVAPILGSLMTGDVYAHLCIHVQARRVRGTLGHLRTRQRQHQQSRHKSLPRQASLGCASSEMSQGQ